MKHLITLYPAPPYNFGLLLEFLARFAFLTLDIPHHGAYWRALRTPSGLALLRVTARGTVASPALDVHYVAAEGQVDLADLVDRVTHILPAAVSHAAFYDVARADARLWNVVEPLVGLPELRGADLYESLTQTIIEQQIAWTAAQRAQRWLIEWAGPSIQHNGLTCYAFPEPRHLAAAAVEDLRPLKITFRRMQLLIDIARRVHQRELDLESLRHQPADLAYQRLLTLRGVGHWTAVVALERAFGHDGWVAHNDVVLQSATNRYFYDGAGRIPPEQVRETFARYGLYAGLAARYTMFRWVLEQYPRRQD